MPETLADAPASGRDPGVAEAPGPDAVYQGRWIQPPAKLVGPVIGQTYQVDASGVYASPRTWSLDEELAGWQAVSIETWRLAEREADESL